MKKTLHKITVTLFTLTLLLWGNVGFGQYSGTGTFNKITTLEEIEDGYYVIVNSTDAFAMNQTNAGKFFTHTEVTPSADALTNPATDIVWNIVKDGTNYTISYIDGTDITYVSYTGNKNEAHAVVNPDPITDNQKWAITIDESDFFKVQNEGVTDRLLQYNTSSPRFACYTGSQQNLSLYKLASAGPDTEAPVPTFLPADAATDVAISVNPTITFDEAIYTSTGTLVDDSNVESLISFTSTTKADVAFSAAIVDKVITIVPDADLDNEMEYSITIQPVQDVAENLMDAAASASFTTISATAQAIEFTGDYAGPYYAGDDVTITWTSTNIDNVKIEAWVPSANEGAGEWFAMVETVAATAETATFTIPADAQYSADYKLRVADLADGTPSAETATFKVREVHSALSTLRARPANTEARFDGSAIVTYSRTARHQKYIQDDNAALLIDDNTFVITQEYPIGSEITGLVGKISIYNALVQFLPLNNPGAPASLDNPVTPLATTLADLTTADQSKLVKLENITFTSTGTFESGKNYNLKDNIEVVGIFRTAFSESDYIGQEIPAQNINEMLLLVGEFNGTLQLTSRSTADWTIISDDATLSTFTLGDDDALGLTGLVVTDPNAEAGATLNILDFTDFKGIVATTNDVKAVVVVKLNGTVVEEANLATQVLVNGDIIIATVTAESGTIINYKVTLSSENRQLVLTAPVGGEALSTGDDAVITWTSANIEKVNIYAVDVTSEEHDLNESPIDATLGTFTYTIKNGTFGDFIIRITDASDESFSDQTATAIAVTDNVAPSPETLFPANAATGIPRTFTLRVDFDEDIKVGDGSITIHKASDDAVVVTIANTQISLDDNVATAPVSGLDWQTAYYVLVDAGLILDKSNNANSGISSKTEWTFTTKEESGPDLFFSEYVEGSSSNKAIEIYNPTASAINLSAYVVKQSYNGGGWGIRENAEMAEYILPLTGTIDAGKVYVIYNAEAVADISTVGDLPLTYGAGCNGCRVAAFTGNDALGLFKDGELIDQIGDPLTSANFDIAGTTAAAADHTIVRKGTIKKGNTNWAASAGTTADNSEWIVYGNDTFNYLGSHDVSQSVKPILGESVAAFPNPFTNILYIDNAENATRVVVINLIGQQVMSVNLNGDSRVPIATEHLAKGIYLISIENNKGERIVRKMIKR